MDKYIYGIGDYTCSLMEEVGLVKLKYMLGCNPYDNYTIGLFIIIILIFMISGGGFFGFSGSGKN